MNGKVATFVSTVGVVACIAIGVSRPMAQDVATKIDIAKNAIAAPPADFEFALTGDGELGQWTVVRDPTASGGIAIEHLSKDQHDDRFPLAIYSAPARKILRYPFAKIVSGTIQTRGSRFRVRNPDSYYAIAASALEHRVDLLLFAKWQGHALRVPG